MPVDPVSGVWSPDLFPKQWELLQACLPSFKNFVLANGPRWASKTFGCQHATAQHAWNTDRGNICILTITQSVGIDSGVWQHLTEIFLPEWINGDFGMEWVREPYIQNVTKKPACELTNRFGNKSRITLESLRNEQEVEARFKGKGYSMIWVNELSKFKHRKTFDTLKQCLRLPHLKDEDHLFLADTNPDLQLGQKSWIFFLWYEFRTMDDATVLELENKWGAEPGMLLPLRDSLRLIEFTVDDNLWLTDQKKGRLRADFAHDRDVFEAYYNGKWGTASTDALFYGVFREGVHVVGEAETPGNKTPDTLVPSDTCSSLVTGWDPGGRNCAAVIAEKQIVQAKKLWPELFTPEAMEKGPVMPSDKEIPVFKFLDELISVDEDFRMEDFVEQFVARMDFWEGVLNLRGKVAWTHWSDRSVYDTMVAWTDKYWVEHVADCSGGRINLIAERGNRGAVSARVDLWRKLLWEQRMWFSAAKTPHLIQMNKSIKRGESSVAIIQKGSIWKHSFDAGSYLVSSECIDELAKSIRFNIRKRHENSLVSVSY